MIEKFKESSGNVIGYKVSGTIKKEDYKTIVPEVEAVVEGEGRANLLMDLTDFKWEALDAWGADMKFGHDYHKKIEKMAIVGDKRWEKWMTKIAEPFYAEDAQYFEAADSEAAWKWLRE